MRHSAASVLLYAPLTIQLHQYYFMRHSQEYCILNQATSGTSLIVADVQTQPGTYEYVAEIR